MGLLGLAAGSAQIGWEPTPGEWELVQRHGTEEDYVLPDRIDHAANMRALAVTGCDRVLAVGSVGSLSPDLEPGAMVVPDDFISLVAPSPTALDGPEAHVAAGFDPDWRDRVVAALADAGVEARNGGVYWQTSGPRFETPAEIRLIASHAEVVGMTIASECAAACQLGMAYAAVCVVDNFANGIDGDEVSVAAIESNRAAGRERLGGALAALLPSLAR